MTPIVARFPIDKLTIFAVFSYIPLSSIFRVAGAPEYAMLAKLLLLILVIVSTVRNHNPPNLRLFFVVSYMLVFFHSLRTNGIIDGIFWGLGGFIAYTALLGYKAADFNNIWKISERRLFVYTILWFAIMSGLSTYTTSADMQSVRMGGDFTYSNPNLIGSFAIVLLITIFKYHDQGMHRSNLSRVGVFGVVILILFLTSSRSACLAALAISSAATLTYGIRRVGYIWITLLLVSITVFAYRGGGDPSAIIEQQFESGGRLEIIGKALNTDSVGNKTVNVFLGSGFGNATSGAVNFYHKVYNHKLAGFLTLKSTPTGGADNAFVAAYYNGGILFLAFCIFMCFGWIRWYTDSVRSLTIGLILMGSVTVLAMSQNLPEVVPLTPVLLATFWSGRFLRSSG